MPIRLNLILNFAHALFEIVYMWLTYHVLYIELMVMVGGERGRERGTAGVEREGIQLM
jgi:hypothetical protein